jgi:hypothetical protein
MKFILRTSCSLNWRKVCIWLKLKIASRQGFGFGRDATSDWERERKEDAFEQSFHAHQESTIRPTFEAIGEYVTTKGYEYRIDTRPESTDREVLSWNRTFSRLFSQKTLKCG